MALRIVDKVSLLARLTTKPVLDPEVVVEMESKAATLHTIHETTYSYREPVVLGPHQMMLRPRETRELQLLAYRLEVVPSAAINWAYDVAGNAVATAVFDAPTNRLKIVSHSHLRLTAAAWPVFDIAATAINYPFLYSDNDWIDLGALTVPQYEDNEGRFARWVRGFVMQEPTDTLSLLKDLSNGVSFQLTYQSRESEGTQTPLETLNRSSGTCRDFAVLLAEAGRLLGFGTRIVSGYLYDPDNSLVGSAGAGSTHAWVEIYLPGAGWITFDPTNRSMGSKNLIPVAVGRDMHQVVPVSGSFGGAPDTQVSMTVSVTVTRDEAN